MKIKMLRDEIVNLPVSGPIRWFMGEEHNVLDSMGSALVKSGAAVSLEEPEPEPKQTSKRRSKKETPPEEESDDA